MATKISELFVLVWNYDRRQPIAPYSTDIHPARGHGRMMVFSEAHARHTAQEMNQMYGAGGKQVELMPLAEFMGAEDE